MTRMIICGYYLTKHWPFKNSNFYTFDIKLYQHYRCNLEHIDCIAFVTLDATPWLSTLQGMLPRSFWWLFPFIDYSFLFLLCWIVWHWLLLLLTRWLQQMHIFEIAYFTADFSLTISLAFYFDERSWTRIDLDGLLTTISWLFLARTSTWWCTTRSLILCSLTLTHLSSSSLWVIVLLGECISSDLFLVLALIFLSSR